MELVDRLPFNESIPNAPDVRDLSTARRKLTVDLSTHALDLASTIHAVERVPSAGRGKRDLFVPVRPVVSNKLTRDDKLLLAFDAVILAEILGRDVAFGKIIYGDQHATVNVKTLALASEVKKLTGKPPHCFPTHPLPT